MGELVSEKYQKVAGLLMWAFTKHYHSSNQKIKSDEIRRRLALRGYKVHDAELRDIIAHVRRSNMLSPGFILSDNGGYWYSEDPKEQKEVWKSQYERALSIMQNFAHLRKLFQHHEDSQGLLLEFEKLKEE